MTTMIIKGVRCTLTHDTAVQIQRDLDRCKAEDDLRKVLRSMDRSDPLYSDLYKDLHGVRPRW